ncbi:hypothetical protein X777_16612 [Ooceraea biroi]|uniref:Uncharacterized protein n=1 Tax=Ooceraea biroi TaxID=2015173 RepID=A0A026VTV6_OOCBI|nr:hypothetical protein X777_16612 [Ooceraea biroi]
MATPLPPMRPKSNRFITTQNGNENWTFALVLAVWGLLCIHESTLYKRAVTLFRFCRRLREHIALNSRSRQEQH